MKSLDSYYEFARKRNAFVIRVERDYSVPPKKFDNNKLWSYYVRIFLDVQSSSTSAEDRYTLDDVTLVRYQLHSSYVDPVRVSEDRCSGFEIKVWTYGFYPIKATVLLRYARTVEIPGNVIFDVTPEERARNSGELQKS